VKTDKKDTKFKQGNEFWRLAKNPGRKTKYTPASLLKKAYEYFAYCDANPWMKNEAVKSGKNTGAIIRIPTQKPYTEIGFFMFAGIDRKMFKAYDRKAEFNPITAHISGIIRNNQLEGALVGAYNANIVARLQGLTERKTLEIARFLEAMEDDGLTKLAEEMLNLTDNDED
jgi:hypothetical protein